MSDLEMTLKIRSGTFLEVSSDSPLTAFGGQLMGVLLRTALQHMWPRQYAIHCGAEHELAYYGDAR